MYLISCKGEGFNDLRCFNVFFNSFFELFMYFLSNSLCIVSTAPYELAKKSYIIDWKLIISVFTSEFSRYHVDYF